LFADKDMRQHENLRRFLLTLVHRVSQWEALKLTALQRHLWPDRRNRRGGRDGSVPLLFSPR
jgi:hypothetical protein